MIRDPLPIGRTAGTTLALAILVAAASGVEGQARTERFTQVPVDPSMPVAEGFDTERALFWAEPNFVPLRDPEWRPLRAVRRAREVADDTPVIVFEAGGQTLALVSSQMSYHHVAQGDMAGEPWMVTF
ncbi:MAG: DUF3179 domain-containing (seleno)protein [Gemmatimonadetes bacterium]|nr:DUF3179 domain-containing (seleno)protein [Gemmatimonadota bacterium]MDA1104128.1 DUF3179 domain-containing (seleno)protein [Gemmatimonadota bacterium]